MAKVRDPYRDLADVYDGLAAAPAFRKFYQYCVLSARMHDLICLNLLLSAFALNGMRRNDGSQPGSGSSP